MSAAGRGDAIGAAAARDLRDLARGPLGGLIDASFRLVPQQDRAMASVERLLAAVPRLVTDSASLKGLTLEALAREANVTPQAAYRYFRDAFAVVRLFARRIQTVEHERLLRSLVDRRFDSAAELAEAAVGFVVEVARTVFTIPAKLRAALLRDHLEICYALVWTVSERVCAAMAQRGDPCGGVAVLALNSALVSVISVAASFCVRGDERLASAPVRGMLQALFRAAIADPAGEAPPPLP